MALTAHTYLYKSPDQLSSLNDIWGTTLVLGLSTSNPGAINPGTNNFNYWTQLVAMDAVDEEYNLGIFQYPPRPYDKSNFPLNYGAFSVANPLRSFLSIDLENYNITTPQISNYTLLPLPFETTIVKYKMVSGYSYNPNLNVEAFQYISGPNNFLGFSFSGSNYFTIGSNVYVVSDNPYISGSHNITGDGFTNSSFVTTTLFTASMTTATPLATITNYSQNDASYTGVENLFGINSVLDYDLYTDGINYLTINASMSTYPIDGIMWKFLSSFENRKSLFPPVSANDRSGYFLTAKKTRVNAFETNTFIIDTAVLDSNPLYLFNSIYSSTYSFIETLQYDLSTILTANTGLQRVDIPIGFNNISGTISNATSSVYCVIRIGDAQEFNVYTELRTYKIDRECTIYDPKTFMFMNKQGAWDYWTFTQDTKEVHSITKNEFKREVPYGDMMARGWGYRGQSVMSGKTQENYTANTNWLTESEYRVLSELVRSPEVYVMVYRPSDSTYYPTPVIITDTSYEVKTSNRDQIFNLTINYKMAIDTPIQRR